MDFDHSREAIGRRIMAHRIQHGYTRTQLGMMLGYSATTSPVIVWKWETADKPVPNYVIRQLSDILKIPIDLLLP